MTGLGEEIATWPFRAIPSEGEEKKMTIRWRGPRRARRTRWQWSKLTRGGSGCTREKRVGWNRGAVLRIGFWSAREGEEDGEAGKTAGDEVIAARGLSRRRN